MNRLPMSTLQRWRNNAAVLAEHAETLRAELSRMGCEERHLNSYAAECKAAAQSMAIELDRLIDLHTLFVTRTAERDTAELKEMTK